MVHDVHDAFFKSTFSQVEHAAGELRVVLPKAITARIDWSTLALCAGSFVDEALAQQHTDLLFSAKIAGRAALIYLLFEHKSGPEALTAFQLLRYMVRIWEDFLASHQAAKLLPAIVPVVVHHGAGGWTVARRFEELLDVDAETLGDLATYMPRFQVMLDDLSFESDEALLARAMSALGRLSLWCLQNARTPGQLVEGIGRWRHLAAEVRRAPHGVAALLKIWRYILLVGERFGPEDLVERLAAAVGEEGKEEVVTAGEQLIERGREQGREQGRNEERRRVLLKQLRARFGAVSDAAVTRLNAASPAELELWVERVLTEASLVDVLGGA